MLLSEKYTDAFASYLSTLEIFIWQCWEALFSDVLPFLHIYEHNMKGFHVFCVIYSYL